MNKFSFKPAYFVILGMVLGLGGFFLILANPFGWKTLRPILKNSPSTSPISSQKNDVTPQVPILILPTGKQTYNVQGGETNISRIDSVTVDPLDVTKGKKQSISISISSKEPITSFVATLNSDSGSKEYPLTLSSGDTTTGVWEASYTVNDSTNKTYNFVFKIITNNGNTTISPFLVR